MTSRAVDGIDTETSSRTTKGFVKKRIAKCDLLSDLRHFLAAVYRKALKEKVGLDVFGRWVAPHDVAVARQHVADPFGGQRYRRVFDRRFGRSLIRFGDFFFLRFRRFVGKLWQFYFLLNFFLRIPIPIPAFRVPFVVVFGA